MLPPFLALNEKYTAILHQQALDSKTDSVKEGVLTPPAEGGGTIPLAEARGIPKQPFPVVIDKNSPLC
jgi:hypothetical protein